MHKEKIWFITGASRGIGFEIAKAALASGDKVAAAIRSKAEVLLSQFDKNANFAFYLLF